MDKEAISVIQKKAMTPKLKKERVVKKPVKK
jgi:hypothetical protein